MKPLWNLDTPCAGEVRGASPEVAIQGWIALAPGGAIENLRFSDPQLHTAFELERHPRADVEQAFNGVLRARGFSASVPFDVLENTDFTTIEFTSGTSRYEIVVPIPLLEANPGKYVNVPHRFACPQCQNTHLESEGKRFICRQCDSSFSSARPYNFLSSDIRQECRLSASKRVSANGYDGEALNVINRFQHGLVLDCGSGRRSKSYPHVVNLDIEHFEYVDVLAVAEHLPFKDDTFDGVLSLAVLEHVQNPFQAAAEMLRVLKPGGIIYCQVPFLAPLHGYPNHYYNMTQPGLRRLFDTSADIEKLEVLNFGQPIFLLSWFLNLYLSGLPRRTAKKFSQMRIGELLDGGESYLGNTFVTELSDAIQNKLACVNYIVATKKERQVRTSAADNSSHSESRLHLLSNTG